MDIRSLSPKHQRNEKHKWNKIKSMIENVLKQNANRFNYSTFASSSSIE